MRIFTSVTYHEKSEVFVLVHGHVMVITRGSSMTYLYYT